MIITRFAVTKEETKEGRDGPVRHYRFAVGNRPRSLDVWIRPAPHPVEGVQGEWYEVAMEAGTANEIRHLLGQLLEGEEV